jgi:MFS family permease
MVGRWFTDSMAFFAGFNRELWILALGWFVGAMGFAASIPFIAIYFHQSLGMSTTEIGVFFGVMAVVRSIFQMVGGELYDSVGRRGLLVTSQYVRAVSFLGLGLFIYWELGFWPIAIALFITSVFGSIFMPAVNAMVADILPEEKRLDGYAISRSAGNLGWAIGPAIGGVLAATSYALLFYLSAGMTFLSGLVFALFLKPPQRDTNAAKDRFRPSDLLALRHEHNLAFHSVLVFLMYLVVAQLIAPFSVYAVDMAGLSEAELGMLYMLNGLLVATLQIPVTRLLAHTRLTTQMAWGAALYFVAYSFLGSLIGFGWFAMIMIIATLGEVTMSPASLTLTSRLAPEGRTGRYMGVFGFFVASGWSLGPLYGGLFLDAFVDNMSLGWVLLSSVALVSAIGYAIFGRYLPDKLNQESKATSG